MPRNHVTHGMSNTRLYGIWSGMKTRCNGTAKGCIKNYYDRGITYCSEWETFEPFRDWALSHGYNDNLTIDRIDNDRGYSPDNCRWITRVEQQSNTRQNRYIEYNGEIHTLTQWSKILGIKANTLKSRLDLYGWSVDEAFNPTLYKGGETRSGIRNIGRKKTVA
jgi:hypothetical protein